MSYVSERLGIDAGDDVSVTGDPAHAPFDIVQVFVRDPHTVEAVLEEAVTAASASDRLWVTVPGLDAETQPDISVETIESILEQRGWTQSMSFTIDVQWHGIKFTPE